MSRRARPLERSRVERRKKVVTYITVEREIVTTGPVYVALGKVLRSLREKAELTQEQLGRRAGFSRTSIINIEQARQRVLLSDLFEFAKPLQITPHKLFAIVATAVDN